MKVGLGIIAKDYSEISSEVEKYKELFDGFIVAIDSGEENSYTKKYEWSEKEKESGKLNFSRKRNFLHNLFIENGYDYYFTIDTDDEIVGIDKLDLLVKESFDRVVDIVYLPYHYSHDEDGNINTVHKKERLIRCTDKIKWNMPVHENMLPVAGYQHSILVSDYMVIVHKCDHDHYDKSFDRNIEYMIDEWNEHKEKTDPRTISYLGRCFGAKKMFKEAIFFLSMHVKKSGWDEDKCMSLCQLADIYREMGEHNTAIQFAFQAMSERHDFPEPYVKLHDIYVDTQKYKKAIHWGNIAKSIKHPETFMIVDPTAIGWRLDLSMSFCYMNEGDVDKAYSLFMKAKKSAPNIDFIRSNEKWYETAVKEKAFINSFMQVLIDVEKNNPDMLPNLVECIPSNMNNNQIVKKLRNKYLRPKEWSDKSITIVCGHTLDEWTPKSLSTGIGGSEEAVIHISNEFTKIGYEVTVYNNCGDDAGNYNGVEYVDFTSLNPNDNFNIVIGWRSNIFRMFDFKAHYKYVWLHDVYQEGTCEDHDTYDAIIVLSQFHKSLLPSCIPDEKIIVSSNGINIGEVEKVERNPHKIIYASSYDRGIEHLLRRWSEVREAVPDAELHIFYGWNNYEKLVRDGFCDESFMLEMKELFSQDGVYEHGRIGQDELHKEFASSAIWVYPSHFEEISCITAMKAQELGCLPVCTDYAALAETVKDGLVVKGKADNPEVMDKLITNLIDALNGKHEVPKCTYDFSWSKVAKQWDEEFKARLFDVNNYESMQRYKEVYSNMSEDNVTIVDKNIMTHRHKYVLDTIVRNDCKSLLDVGTFDGAVAVYAARMGIDSTGIDINTTFIETGRSVAPNNCTLIGGTTFEDFTTDDKFDAVSATEVIEHVIDVDEFLGKIHSLLNDGGIVVISTPHRLGKYGVTNHDVHHIRHYLEETLKADMSKYFDVKHMTVEADLINCYGVKKCLV